MPSRTIREFAAAALREHPLHELVRSGGVWRETPPKSLDRRSLALAAALVTYGLEPGARAAALTWHGGEALLGFLAVLRAAGTFVPLHPALPNERLLEALTKASVRQILVSDDEQLGRLLAIRPELPELDLILLFREAGTDRAAAQTVDGACAVGEDALAQEPALLSREPPGGDETPVVLLETEGGEVALTGGNVLAAADAAGTALAIDRGEVVLSALPSSDAAQLALALACLARGATLAHVHPPGELAEALLGVRPHVAVIPRFLSGALREAVDSAAGAGTWLGSRLLRFAIRQGEKRGAPDLAAGRLPAARTWGWRAAEALVVRRVRQATGGRLVRLVSLGEPLPAAESAVFLSLGIPFLEGIAIPETGGLVAVNRADAVRPGTAGRLVAGLEAKGGPAGTLELRGPMVCGGGARSVFLRGHLDSDGYLSGASPG